MSLVSLLQFYLPRVAFRRSTTEVLARELSAEQAERIWNLTKERQAELWTTRPRHSFGVNFVLRYFEWDCALYQALREEGVPEANAGELVQEVTWGVFGPVIALNFSVSRLRSRHLRARVQWVVDMMFRVLFTSPFERTVVPSSRDVAFDVTVCPLAQYFRAQGVPELTRYAACGLDYRMASVWGVRLERSQTLAEGGELCDFRFRVLPATGDDAEDRAPTETV